MTAQAPDPAPDPPPPADPVLEARIEHAVKPYVGRLTPEALAECRRVLALILTSHPRTAALLDRIRQPSVPDSSGVVVRQGSRDGGAVDLELEAKKVG